MTLEEFRNKSSFSREEIIAFVEGARGLPALPGSLLLPFHAIPRISWDEASKTGRVEAVRHNRLDDWFYACHFLGDPVMPGCWGIDAVWQVMRLFAAWRGLPDCDKTLGMEDVSFFGQIRPYDKEIVYAVDIVSIEESDGERSISGKATVSVDGARVYTIGTAQVATAFWEAGPAVKPEAARRAPEGPMSRRLSWAEFSSRDSFSQTEVLALSQGTLVDAPSMEMGLLPSSLMLEIGQIHHISYDGAADEGRILAAKQNSPLEWFYAMNRGTKPTALIVDGVWQLLGLFLAWRRNTGTGRALGFDRVEVFDSIRPTDVEILYDIRISRTTRAEGTDDAFARGDAKVFANERLVLACENANVGYHKNIRYSEYPRMSDMGIGGKLKARNNGD